AASYSNAPQSTASCPFSFSQETRCSFSSKPAWSVPRNTRMRRFSQGGGRRSRGGRVAALGRRAARSAVLGVPLAVDDGPVGEVEVVVRRVLERVLGRVLRRLLGGVLLRLARR